MDVGVSTNATWLGSSPPGGGSAQGPRSQSERGPCLWLSLGGAWIMSPGPAGSIPVTKVDMATGPGGGQSPVSPQSPPAWGQMVLSQGSPLAYSLRPSLLGVYPSPLAHHGHPQESHGNWVGMGGCWVPGWQWPEGPS